MPRVRKVLEGILEGKNLVVLLSYDEPFAEGKFLLGACGISGDAVALVFDSTQPTHRALANRYGLRPWGGGWLSLDTKRRKIRITGMSQDYGREPDRKLTLQALERAFPDYEVSEM
jgi:hypothetical protein